MFSSYITFFSMPDKLTMTYRRKKRSRSWGNQKDHDLQEKKEIQVKGNPERPWPAGGKRDSGHGVTRKTMTCRRKKRSRSWRNREDHDLQEKKEIQVMEEQGRPWSTRKKRDPGHEKTGKAMTCKEKWNSDHRENGNSMVRRFCLSRINCIK